MMAQHFRLFFPINWYLTVKNYKTFFYLIPNFTLYNSITVMLLIGVQVQTEFTSNLIIYLIRRFLLSLILFLSVDKEMKSVFLQFNSKYYIRPFLSIPSGKSFYYFFSYVCSYPTLTRCFFLLSTQILC